MISRREALRRSVFLLAAGGASPAASAARPRAGLRLAAFRTDVTPLAGAPIALTT